VKIAQVIPLFSADGRYGGPTSVAREQVAGLVERGHQVTVFAGWDGRASTGLPPGAEVKLFRTRRVLPGAALSEMIAPGLVRQLRRSLSGYDAVHVHLARDLITMPAAFAARDTGRLFVQPHGQIVADARGRSRVMDALATRRVLTGAAGVFHLTGREQRELAAVAPAGSVAIALRNGVGPSAIRTRTESGPVIFCARLHPRKRISAFVEMAELLTARGIDADYLVYGPDGGDLPWLLDKLRRDALPVRYAGALASGAVADALAHAGVLVLPSVDEPFPMVVLEALTVGTPVVLTDTCGIAAELAASGAAAVTDGSPTQLADAVARLVSEPSAWRQQSAAGSRAVQEGFGLSAVLDQLERSYRSVASNSRGGSQPCGC
jgi:glycosyltransferase involved in cell wall biosynthesis